MSDLPPLIIFPDTNVLVQGRALHDLPWSELGAGPIDIVPESSHNPFGVRMVLAPGERKTLWRDFTSDKDGVTSADVKLHVTGKVPDQTDPTQL